MNRIIPICFQISVDVVIGESFRFIRYPAKLNNVVGFTLVSVGLCSITASEYSRSLQSKIHY